MAATSPIAALYFVALMTFGNYVLFNLLVAILVEGFQAEVNRPLYLSFPSFRPRQGQGQLVGLLSVVELRLSM